jgi:hypothetical protein
LKPEHRTLVALDTPDIERARVLARVLAGRVGGFKIGLEAFVACGPALVDEMRRARARRFSRSQVSRHPQYRCGRHRRQRPGWALRSSPCMPWAARDDGPRRRIEPRCDT